MSTYKGEDTYKSELLDKVKKYRNVKVTMLGTKHIYEPPKDALSTALFEQAQYANLHWLHDVVSQAFKENIEITNHLAATSTGNKPLLIVDFYWQSAVANEDYLPRYKLGMLMQDAQGTHSFIQTSQYSYSKKSEEIAWLESNDDTALNEILMDRYHRREDQKYLKNHLLAKAGMYLQINTCPVEGHEEGRRYTILDFIEKTATLLKPANLEHIKQEKENKKIHKQSEDYTKASLTDKKQEEQEQINSLITSIVKADPLGLGGMSADNVRDILGPLPVKEQDFLNQDPLADEAFSAFYKDLKRDYPNPETVQNTILRNLG